MRQRPPGVPSPGGLALFPGRAPLLRRRRERVNKNLALVAMIFAVCSALCGATPTGRWGESWMIAFRADALNRAPDASFGEITGITQTVGNLGASIGLAVMGSIFATQNVSRVGATLIATGVPVDKAHAIAHQITSAGANSAQGGQMGGAARATFEAIQLDIAHVT